MCNQRSTTDSATMFVLSVAGVTAVSCWYDGLKVLIRVGGCIAQYFICFAKPKLPNF